MLPWRGTIQKITLFELKAIIKNTVSLREYSRCFLFASLHATGYIDMVT
jgi:hypothetical protein